MKINIILLISLLIITTACNNSNSTKQKNEATAELNVSLSTPLSREEALKEYVKVIKKTPTFIVSIVDEDGTLIIISIQEDEESYVEEIIKLENKNGEWLLVQKEKLVEPVYESKIEDEVYGPLDSVALQNISGVNYLRFSTIHYKDGMCCPDNTTQKFYLIDLNNLKRYTSSHTQSLVGEKLHTDVAHSQSTKDKTELLAILNEMAEAYSPQAGMAQIDKDNGFGKVKLGSLLKDLPNAIIAPRNLQDRDDSNSIRYMSGNDDVNGSINGIRYKYILYNYHRHNQKLAYMIIALPTDKLGQRKSYDDFEEYFTKLYGEPEREDSERRWRGNDVLISMIPWGAMYSYTHQDWAVQIISTATIREWQTARQEQSKREAALSPEELHALKIEKRKKEWQEWKEDSAAYARAGWDK